MTRIISSLDRKFAWIGKEPGPKHLLEAWALVGVHEGIGNADSPVILAWAREVCVEATYKHDSIPWCGLFVALVSKRAGLPVVKDPLWAANWLHVGAAVDTKDAKLADFLIFDRPGGHHVGFYAGETELHYFVLGGNESDAVNVVPIFKDRLHGVRRPAYAVPPPNLRKVLVSIDGDIKPSVDEA